MTQSLNKVIMDISVRKNNMVMLFHFSITLQDFLALKISSQHLNFLKMTSQLDKPLKFMLLKLTQKLIRYS